MQTMQVSQLHLVVYDLKKDREGVIPSIIKQYYDERRVIKKLMIEKQKEYQQNPSRELDNRDSTIGQPTDVNQDSNELSLWCVG